MRVEYQNKIAQVQAIINQGRHEGLVPDEILNKVERYLCIIVDAVIEDYNSGNYYITTPATPEGKYIVPKHKDIPEESWGKLVDNRSIKFYYKKS